MSRFYRFGTLAVLGAALLAAVGLAAGHRQAGAADRVMPEFAHATPDAWLNSAPLKASSFRGKVVLLEVYASG